MARVVSNSSSWTETVVLLSFWSMQPGAGSELAVNVFLKINIIYYIRTLAF